MVEPSKKHPQVGGKMMKGFGGKTMTKQTKQDKESMKKNTSKIMKDGTVQKKLKVRLKQEPEIIEEEEKPVLIFKGLINEATRLSLSSPLKDTLDCFYMDVAHVPEETIINIKQEFQEVLPFIQKKLTKVKAYLKFSTPVLPDFTGNDVITSGELDVLLPFKPPAYKEEHVEPGYMSVVLSGRKRDVDDDDAGTGQLFKSKLTTDSKRVSPLKVCQVLHDGFCPPPPKKTKGKKKPKMAATPSPRPPTGEGSAISKDDRASVASLLDANAMNGRLSGSSRDVFTHKGQSRLSHLSDEACKHSDDVALSPPYCDEPNAHDQESNVSTKDTAGTEIDIQAQSTPGGSVLPSPADNHRSKIGSHPPSREKMGVKDEVSENECGSEKDQEETEPPEDIKVEPFTIDNFGANVIVAYKSLRVRLVPALSVRPGDEVSEHDFLVSKPFEHDTDAKSHLLWRQSCLTRERVITRSMSMADGGVRLKTLRTMMSLASLDHGLEGLSPYIIRTVFLHNFDNTIDVTPRWQRSSIEKCFIPLLKDLSCAFNRSRLQHFFLKDVNVLNGISPTTFARIRSRLSLLSSSDAALLRALKNRPC